MKIKLRDYQAECITAINNLPKGSVLVSMATGLGKTVIFSQIERKGRVLVISHREELVFQPEKYYDCPCGIEMGERKSNGEPVVLASVQSLINRLDRFSPTEFDTIITDEAHHAAAPSYKKIYAHFKPRLHVGFTATPNRGDKVRLDDVFDKILFQRDLKWGILQNWLCDVRCLRVKVSYDLRGVKRRMGDFVVGDLDRSVNNTVANGEIADVYSRYAKGQTLIFATSVAHAQNIASQIKGAVAVTQSTKNRNQIIKDFTDRKIPCLVNCMIFTEGTDMPLIETIIIARPTQNASLYAQMVGRGLRKASGKDYLTLIDCVGVTDNLDICTAPSLMGLDADDLPERQKLKIEGMLTQMPAIIENARDCPETWLLNASAVKLFEREQGVSVHDVNWSKRANGDFVYQFACGDRIGVKAMNELGKSKIMRYVYSENAQKFVYSESEEMPVGLAFSRAHYLFESEYANERNLWDSSLTLKWEGLPATQKQLDFIKDRLSQEEWEEVIKRGTLSKRDAGQIINQLNIRSLKPNDLLRMRQKQKEREQEQEQLAKAYKALKIRKLIDKKRRTYKYYAIKHPTDLIITNSWEIASEQIAILNASGEQCRYKGFATISQAEEFLRS